MMIKTVCCIIAFHCVTAGALCPNGWTRFLDSCYFFTPDDFPFTEAEHYCAQQGSHLVHVNNAIEGSFLKGVLMQLKPAKHWIGLTDRDTEGVWMWLDTYQPANYTDWYSGEPNSQGSNVDCVAIRADHNNQWTDENCDYILYAICEKGTESPVWVG